LIFGQTLQKLKKDDKKREAFKQNNTEGRVYSVQFLKEGSIDAGGPYRDYLSNLATEI
jgi:hypothetical protein